jgi:hypothetical protein
MLYSASDQLIAGRDTASGSIVELLSIKDAGDMYEIVAAVDGQKLPSFYESRANVRDMNEDALMEHLKEQAVSMSEFCQENR